MKLLCKKCFCAEYPSDYQMFFEMSAIDVICEKCGNKKRVVVNYSMVRPKKTTYLSLGPSETSDD